MQLATANNRVDAFVLQDHLDYLHPNEIKVLWQEINRCAAPGAKVLNSQPRNTITNTSTKRLSNQHDTEMADQCYLRNKELQNKDQMCSIRLPLCI